MYMENSICADESGTQRESDRISAARVSPKQWRTVLANHSGGIPEFQRVCGMLVFEIENLSECLSTGKPYSPLWTLADLPASVNE